MASIPVFKDAREVNNLSLRIFYTIYFYYLAAIIGLL